MATGLTILPIVLSIINVSIYEGLGPIDLYEDLNLDPIAGNPTLSSDGDIIIAAAESLLAEDLDAIAAGSNARQTATLAIAAVESGGNGKPKSKRCISL